MPWSEARDQVDRWKKDGDKIVFTNGCFDILHMGHITYLEQAANLGERLIIGVNSDRSTTELKGPFRPINQEYSRMYLLGSLSFVDCVVKFDEATPYNLIDLLSPDVLVKGGDYQIKDIVGADIVQDRGGEVRVIDFVEGQSTTDVETRILNLHRFKSFEESE